MILSDPHSKQLEIFKRVRAKKADALEKLECHIYELEGEFIKSLYEVGTFVSRIPIMPKKPFKRSHFHYEVDGSIVEKLKEGTTDEQTQNPITVKQQKKKDTAETFLGARHSAVLREAFIETCREYPRCVIDESIMAADVPKVSLISQRSSRAVKYPPMGYSFLALPRETDRMATFSSASAIAAVEKHSFPIARMKQWSNIQYPNISRYSPFAVFPLAHAISERKHDSDQSKASVSKEHLKKEKRVSFWRNNGPS